MTTALKTVGKLSLALLLAASLNGVALAGVAPVEGSAAMKSPANNAAVVAKLIGLVNNRVEKTALGKTRTINDGVVIRQSYIKDGKKTLMSSGARLRELSDKPQNMKIRFKLPAPLPAQLIRPVREIRAYSQLRLCPFLRSHMHRNNPPNKRISHT